MKKIILHIDMDAFFASVEQMDNIKLKGKPVIVGGNSERGVVSTCSYEARKYGIHSAMPIFMAKNLCPNGIYVPVRMNRYKEISSEIFSIFSEVTHIIEPLSIDEAFLDLGEKDYEYGYKVALYIKKKVMNKLGLTLSVGISYNKFLAKLASDWNKPNGIMVIKEEMVPEILLPLPLGKIFGIGKKTVKKLNNMGLFYVKDIYELPKEFFLEYLGKLGIDIYFRIRGIDNRDVVVSRERKSIGKERTLRINSSDKNELLNYIRDFSKEISIILKRKRLRGRTITVKYKTEDFESHTRSKTLLHYIEHCEDIYNVAKEILDNENLEKDLRLIGLSISSFKEEKSEQLNFFNNN
ncbi:MAG: DNA polymerase IV [Clostridiales bacterium]|nr:DNA polymerase IV [Clostridiales bacterium]